MRTLPASFYDFSASQLPVQIWLLDPETYELCWHVKIEGAGVVTLPGKAEANNGNPVTVVVTDAEARVAVWEPSDA